MTLYPNGKINLGLFVTEKRHDGYHSIETIMVPIPLFDTLSVSLSVSGSSRMIVSGIPISGRSEDNLCMKAVNLMASRHGTGRVLIRLKKGIPIGAGLGGGSADGAFTLVILNEIFNCGLSVAQLESLALELGSDCPFFIRNTPAFATGRGELLRPVSLDLGDDYLVMVKPDIAVSTRTAYQNITPIKAKVSLEEVVKLPKNEWKLYINNDFMPYVLQQNPHLENIIAAFYEAGAYLAQMSGSGPTFYGLFKAKPDFLPLHLEEIVLFKGFMRQGISGTP